MRAGGVRVGGGVVRRDRKNSMGKNMQSNALYWLVDKKIRCTPKNSASGSACFVFENPSRPRLDPRPKSLEAETRWRPRKRKKRGVFSWKRL